MRKSNLIFKTALNFCLVMSVMFLLAGCSSKPSESDAKALFEKKTNELLSRPENQGTKINIKRFKKTDGQLMEQNGVKMYLLSYEVEFECSKNIIKVDPFVGMRTTIYNEGLNKDTGSFGFQKSEKGWSPSFPF